LSADFQISKERTLGHEGYYSNVATDKGKETWVGISRAIWPGWEGWPIVDNHKAACGSAGLVDALKADTTLKAMVDRFYYQNFWANHSLEVLTQELADKIFDMAVNCGVFTAGYVVQRMLNFGNRDQRDYPDLKEDGHMGPVTMAALNKLVGLRGEKVAMAAIVFEHYTVYRDIVKKDPGQEANWWGWFKRNLSYLQGG